MVDNIDDLYEQIEQAGSAVINNYQQSDVNYPKDPYTQERIYATVLLDTCHWQGFNDTYDILN